MIPKLSTIQFRLAFKDKGHKSLEYYCLVIHLTSVISTISYPESNGDIFIVIAPRGILYKYKDKRSASDLSTIRTASDLSTNYTI
jgi:hypothetical protein